MSLGAWSDNASKFNLTYPTAVKMDELEQQRQTSQAQQVKQRFTPMNIFYYLHKI
jgi:hypothetical protein